MKVSGIDSSAIDAMVAQLKAAAARAQPAAGAGVASDAQADIVQALVALGYSEKDAAAVLKKLPPDVGVSDGIKLALKALG